MRLLTLFLMLCALADAPRAEAVPVKAFDAPLFVFGQGGGPQFRGTPPGSLKPLLRDVIGRWFGEDRPVQTAFGATIVAWRGDDWSVFIVMKRPENDALLRVRDWFGTSIPVLGPDGYVEPVAPGSGRQDIAAIPLTSALPLLATALLALGLARRQRRRIGGAALV